MRPATPAPIRIDVTQDQADTLRERYSTDDASDALVKMLLAMAGLWVLGEIVRESEKPKPRPWRKSFQTCERPAEMNTRQMRPPPRFPGGSLGLDL